MKLDKWSASAESYARHRAKQFIKVFKLPDRANRHRLNSLFVGQSLFFRTDEYDKGTLADLIRTVARYNANYSVQFKVFKTPAHYEVARIA